MKSTEKINRNQFMMTSLDDMITPESNVRVIDAYVQSLDVESLGYKVYTNKVVGVQFGDGTEIVQSYHIRFVTKIAPSLNCKRKNTPSR